MIFYRVEIELTSELRDDENKKLQFRNEWEQENYLAPYNARLLDL